MTDDETAIRTLITEWADAVHVGDLDGVLADHSEAIVMFDVPRPTTVVRGITAYRETWPPFFDWQAAGAFSTSSPSRSPRATTSPSRTRCCDAVPKKSFVWIRTTCYGSPSGSARPMAAGSSPTSTTPFPPREGVTVRAVRQAQPWARISAATSRADFGP